MPSSSNRFSQSERVEKRAGTPDNDTLSQVSSSSTNLSSGINTSTTPHTDTPDSSVQTEISQYRTHLRTIHDRMQQTAAFGQSLVSTEHEIQLYLKELKDTNPRGSSLQDAFDDQQEKKSQELQEKINSLTKKSEDIVAETAKINRLSHSGNTLVCINLNLIFLDIFRIEDVQIFSSYHLTLFCYLFYYLRLQF